MSPLERDYGVFRRATTPADKLPLTAKQRDALARSCRKRRARPVGTLETARLVHRDGERRFYLLEGRSRAELCVGRLHRHKGGGGSCTAAKPESLAKPMGAYGSPAKGTPASGFRCSRTP